MSEQEQPDPEGSRVERGVRPQPGEMRPFEWMRWEALDLGAGKLADACAFLIGSRKQALEDADWQTSRRVEAQAERDRLRRCLEAIRDTRMTAEDAAEHAAATLLTIELRRAVRRRLSNEGLGPLATRKEN